MAAKILDRAEFLAVDLQFFFYSFDIVPDLSNRIGYFFFCFPERICANGAPNPAWKRRHDFGLASQG
jgi:hypothetical protein